jgi:hypothetical protein
MSYKSSLRHRNKRKGIYLGNSLQLKLVMELEIRIDTTIEYSVCASIFLIIFLYEFKRYIRCILQIELGTSNYKQIIKL